MDTICLGYDQHARANPVIIRNPGRSVRRSISETLVYKNRVSRVSCICICYERSSNYSLRFDIDYGKSYVLLSYRTARDIASMTLPTFSHQSENFMIRSRFVHKLFLGCPRKSGSGKGTAVRVIVSLF